MRRLSASLLRTLASSMALLLTLQSAGPVLAAPPERASPPVALNAIANALQTLRATRVGAILSGDGGRWAAMHAPPPVFKHETPPLIIPPDQHVNDSRLFRTGVFRAGPPMMSRPKNLNEAVKDPRAMRQGGANGTPCARTSLVCTKPLVLPSVGAGTKSIIRAGQMPQFRPNPNVHSMSITPTVQPFLFEADTSAGPTTPIFVTAGIESGAISQTMDSAPATHSANQTLTYSPYTGSVSFGWVSPANVPNAVSWPAQTYTVNVNITQANANMKITEVKVLRVDSTGGGGSDGLATVGDLSGLAQTLGTTGTLAFTISGVAQTASATDRIAVKFVVQNAVTTTQSFSYLAGQNSGSGVNLNNVSTLSPSTTGINSWWTYQNGVLPGHGRYLVNVGNGNVLLQATDVDVPERGVDLAFQRTYNSQSKHDSNNTDGSVPNNYGDGWTNTVDAHVAYHGANTISVYDIDGARYDYTADGNGNWSPPPGKYATLSWDGLCGYKWTKTTGTIYYFYSPDLNETASCSKPYPQDAAYGGRLYEILGRNHNNYIQFTYAWVNGDASNPSNLTEVDATHADGQVLKLKFGAAVSGGPTELLTVTQPDSQVINYYYDGTGANLQWVYRPGNNASSVHKESYGYNSGHQLRYATSPRYNISTSDGDVTYFNYDSSNRLTMAYDWGLVDFTPSDGTSTVLQSPAPASTPLQTFRTFKFSGYGTGTTTASDSYNGQTLWTIDSTGRVTQKQLYIAYNNLWLVSNASWNPNNQLAEYIDEGGNATDFAYDTNGDLSAVALPLVTVNDGTYRPTYVLSYDGNHNVTAACDPIKSHSKGLDWTGNPGTSSSRCPSESGAVLNVWDTTDAAEPYGRLSGYYAAGGYYAAISSTSTQEGGVDAGLPTSIQGQPIAQLDTTSRTPTQSMTYDAHGNLLSVNAGNGSVQYAYDSMNRILIATDADNVSSYACYYNDGSIRYAETASQHNADGSPSTCQATPPPNAASWKYDGDENATTESHHYGNIGGTTTRWYDGGDRLVEVQLPHDGTVFPNTTQTHDLYSFAWMARYLYDNTNGSVVIGDGNTYPNHGNIYKIQEYLPSNPVIQALTVPSSPAWIDVRAWSFDLADRLSAVYENALGPNERIGYVWDGGSPSTQGKLVGLTYGNSSTSPMANIAYDATGWISQISYSNDGGATPTKTYTYNADGRPTTLNSSTFGNETRSYDPDGNLTGVIEPTSYTSYGNISYGYYADGLRKTVGISASAVPAGSALQYSYRADGLLQTEGLSWASNTPFSLTYSNAGRLQAESDPSTGQTVTIYNASTGASTGTSRTLVNRQVSYDSYGRVSQMILPEGYTYGSFAYDDEDEPTSYQLTNGLCNNSSGSVFTCSAASATHTYSARGELLEGRQSANGFLCTSDGSGGCAEAFDARNNMLLSAQGFTYGYDGSGRQTTVTKGGTITRAFDNDSHLVSQANNSSAAITCTSGVQYGCDPDYNTVEIGSAATYTWGTNGHPVKLTQNIYGGGPTYVATYWAHWDPASNGPLFETGNAGTSLALGPLGSSNATNGATVEDRDPFGQVAATHTGYQFSAWTQAPAAKPMGRLGWYTSGAVGSSDPGTDPQSQGRYLDHSRPDAYIDATYGVSFQGVRTADVNTTQWMMPDWFGGYRADLISQQPYLWNGNNSLMNQDPSGFVYAPCDKWGGCLAPKCDLCFGDLGNVFAALGAPGPDDYIAIYGPIIIRPTSNVYFQACGSASVVQGCMLVDGCLNVVRSSGGTAYGSQGTPTVRGQGASGTVGAAIPYPGHNPLAIFTGPSFGLTGKWEGITVNAFWNQNGIAAGLGVGTGLPSFGYTVGQQLVTGICESKPR